MQTIPLQTIPAQQFRIVLDGQNCTITLRQKGERLYIDLLVDDTAVICGGICLDMAPLIPFAQTIFKGDLRFYDTLGTQAPHWEGLNDRYILLYFSDSETLPQEFPTYA